MRKVYTAAQTCLDDDGKIRLAIDVTKNFRTLGEASAWLEEAAKTEGGLSIVERWLPGEADSGMAL